MPPSTGESPRARRVRPTTVSKQGSPRAGSRGAKNRKADGTVKKRWTPAERLERNHAKRRGGGQRRQDDWRTPPAGERRSERNDSGRSDRFNAGGDRTETRYAAPRRDDRYAPSSREDRYSAPRRDRYASSSREDRYSASPRRDDRYAPSSRDARYSAPRRDAAPARDDRYSAPRRDDRDATPTRDDRYSAPRRDDRYSAPGRDDRSTIAPRAGRPAAARPSERKRFDAPARPWNGSRPLPESAYEERPQRAWGRDARPSRPGDRRDRYDTHDRDRHAGGHSEPASDVMEWHDAEVAAVDTAHVTAAMGFSQLGLPAVLVAALEGQGITEPFPIQAAAIPDALAGRDVLGRGQTGSGKTLAFGLPMITRLAATPKAPRGSVRGVVMVPTRELALQVADVLAPLAKLMGLSLTLVAGGMSYGPQLKAFDRGLDVVVATPGRLIDLMNQGVADLSHTQVTVLDEADHMADLGFLPDMTTILDAVPAGQRLLFSATLDRGIDTIVRRYLHDPVTHEVDSDRASVSTMEHRVLHVHPHDKQEVTALIAARPGRSLVFVRTQRGADRVAEQLRAAGVLAGALHGGLTQGARTRVLNAFKSGTMPVLVATDVAARGIHVDDVSLVLHVDPPAGSKDYLHRAGRTARAGGDGVVVSLVLPHQRRDVKRLVSQAGVRVEGRDARPGDAALADLVGDADGRHPITEEAYARLIAPPVKERKRSVRPGMRRPGGRRRDWS